MPQFLTLYAPAAAQNAPPADPEAMAPMHNLVEEMMKSGVLVMTGWLPRDAGDFRVQLNGGAFNVIDGAARDKSQNGFALLKTNTREEAIDAIKRFMKIAGDGVCEALELRTAPTD
jgi:hypothetical protein